MSTSRPSGKSPQPNKTAAGSLRRDSSSGSATHHPRKSPPAPPRIRRRISPLKLAALVAAVIGVVCALSLTLRDSGYMALVSWVPAPIARWCDSNGEFRNFPAFFLLSIPFLTLFGRRRHRVYVGLTLCGFAAAIELAQYFLPQRWVEWQDIAWSWVGIVLAWASFELTRLLVGGLLASRAARKLRAAVFVPHLNRAHEP